MTMYGPVVIILAAGKSERFYASGAEHHKLDAELCGRRVLDRTLESVQQSALPWYVVQPEARPPAWGTPSGAVFWRHGRHKDGLFCPLICPWLRRRR